MAKINLDSLLEEKKSISKDTLGVELLLKIGEAYYLKDLDSAKKYWEKGIEFIGQISEKQRKSNAAKKLKARLFNNLGAVSLYEARMTESIDYFLKSLEIKEALGDKHGIGTTSNNLGYLMSQQGNYEEAITFHQKSLGVRKELNDSAGISQSYNNIGYMYYEQFKMDSALVYFQKSLVLRKLISHEIGIANCLNNVGLIYDYWGQIDSAELYFSSAAEYFEKTEDNNSLSLVYANLAGLRLDRGDYNIALELAKKGEKYAKKDSVPGTLIEVTKMLFQVYEAKGKYKEAYKYLELHNFWSDSVRNANSEKETLKKQMEYEYHQEKLQDSITYANEAAIAESKIYAKEQEVVAGKEKLRKENVIKYALITGVLMAILISLLLVRSNRQKKRDNELITQQKKEVENQKDIIAEQHKEISDSINYAEIIQGSVLPHYQLTDLAQDSGLFFRPKDKVSGDFYWLEASDEKKFYAVADCTGHGIPGAFISMIGTILLNEIYNSKKLVMPNMILDELSRLVSLTLTDKEGATMNDGMDIAFVVQDSAQNKLYYSGANNPVWIISDQDRVVVNGESREPNLSNDSGSHLFEIKGTKQAIGKAVLADKKPFELNEITGIGTNTSFYLFSDGFPDQFGGEKGKKYMYKRFKKFLLDKETLAKSQLVFELQKEFESWTKGYEQIDDVCVLAVKI